MIDSNLASAAAAEPLERGVAAVKFPAVLQSRLLPRRNVSSC